MCTILIVEIVEKGSKGQSAGLGAFVCSVPRRTSCKCIYRVLKFSKNFLSNTPIDPYSRDPPPSKLGVPPSIRGHTLGPPAQSRHTANGVILNEIVAKKEFFPAQSEETLFILGMLRLSAWR
jgi:hypothetical protein